MHMSRPTLARLPLVLPAVAALALAAAAAPKPAPAPRLVARMAQLPLAFEANQGQTAAPAQFLARTQGGVVFLTAHGAVIKSARRVVALRFAGARATAGRPRTAPGAPAHYFLGRRSLTAPTYGAIEYAGIYPGVNLLYHGRQGRLEYDLRLAPRAAVHSIVLQVAGAQPRLNPDGSLQAAPGVRFAAPLAYQTIDGRRRPVAARYVRRGAGFGFALGAYDRAQPLVIDPILDFSSLLGGSQYNQAQAVAVDASGDGFIVGYTVSADFPTLNPIQAHLATGTFGATNDAFVAEIKPDGSGLVYSTYLGGSGDDRATGVAVDATGAVYVCGFTSSTDFPTAAPLQSANAGQVNAFVAKLNPAGSALVYSTYLGGSLDDQASAIAIDNLGDAYVTGTATSTNFPVTATRPQASFAGTNDAFATEINAAGNALVWSTYIGGSGVTHGNGIAVSSTGNAYVVGSTTSNDFPVTAGAYQTSLAGKENGFIAEIDRSGSRFDYATYLGGSKVDEINAVAVDAGGNAFVAGDTNSINIFPTASSAFQQAFAGGSSDAFVAELNGAGSTLVYGSYLGGSANDVATGIAIDSTDEVYVTGYTSSSDFPVTSNAYQTTLGGNSDAFLSKFNAVGGALLYSTYFGGTALDAAYGIGYNPGPGGGASASLYIVGETSSTNFPTTTGAFQTTTNNSSNVAFVAKFVTAPQGVFSPTELGFAAQAPTVASTAQAAIFTNGGELPLTITGIATTGPFAETDNCNANGGTLQPGASCTINVTFTPTTTGSVSGSVVVSDNAPGGSQTLPLVGSGGTFTLTAAPTTTTVAAGSTATFSVEISPAVGYTKVVTLSCSGIGATQNATCTPSPTTVTLNGTTASTATMTVDTTIRPAAIPPLPAIPPGPWTWLALFGFAGAALASLWAWRQRSSRRAGVGWLGAALIAGWALAAVACGGTTTNPGTAAGNYTLTFTGTSGSDTAAATVTLTVD
jgi:hypothetical protein